MNAHKSISAKVRQRIRSLPDYPRTALKCGRCGVFLHRNHDPDEAEYLACDECQRRVCYRCEAPVDEPHLCVDCAERPPALDLVITRHNGAWCFVMGSHYLPVYDDIQHVFSDTVDPLDVAKSINQRTAGPINVIVNL